MTFNILVIQKRFERHDLEEPNIIMYCRENLYDSLPKKKKEENIYDFNFLDDEKDNIEPRIRTSAKTKLGTIPILSVYFFTVPASLL